MFPNQGSGPPWQRFSSRILTVGATWGALALVARLLSPEAALSLGLIPLAFAVGAAWQARRSGKWHGTEHLHRRQVTAVALVLAGVLFYSTAWALRDRVPGWALWMEVGVLLHYWLLTLA